MPYESSTACVSWTWSKYIQLLGPASVFFGQSSSLNRLPLWKKSCLRNEDKNFLIVMVLSLRVKIVIISRKLFVGKNNQWFQSAMIAFSCGGFVSTTVLVSWIFYSLKYTLSVDPLMNEQLQRISSFTPDWKYILWSRTYRLGQITIDDFRNLW